MLESFCCDCHLASSRLLSLLSRDSSAVSSRRPTPSTGSACYLLRFHGKNTLLSLSISDGRTSGRLFSRAWNLKWLWLFRNSDAGVLLKFRAFCCLRSPVPAGRTSVRFWSHISRQKCVYNHSRVWFYCVSLSIICQLFAQRLIHHPRALCDLALRLLASQASRALWSSVLAVIVCFLMP